MKKKLLLKFADFLEQRIERREFEFCTVISRFKSEDNNTPICCTVGCAIGWLPEFHKTTQAATELEWVRPCDVEGFDSDAELFMFDGESMDYVDLATAYFDIPVSEIGKEAAFLFSPHAQEDIVGWGDFPVCDDRATPKDVANAIRHYVKIRS